MLVCMDRVSYYLEYPHVTKLDEVAATNLTFPAVTFCNLNEFRFSKITKNDLYHVGELLALLNNNHQIANPHLAEAEVLAVLKEKANFQNFKPKLFNMTDFYNRTGHDIGDMLLQCTFRGEDCFAVNFTTYSGEKGSVTKSKSWRLKCQVYVQDHTLQCKKDAFGDSPTCYRLVLAQMSLACSSGSSCGFPKLPWGRLTEARLTCISTTRRSDYRHQARLRNGWAYILFSFCIRIDYKNVH
ncbi:hypothetical protein CCH79_00005399 [Gambusia affinis]|uniref:Uncharacterized protein n=1 Tax=Gambusia affinis TaxID=33528 RepID=A0A315VPL8_GAMAF|nr:hypothetical protein CCH79_00005399 [Gambusia affinis]